MFSLDPVAKLFKALNRGASPNQLAAGFVFGILIGLVPGWPLHILLVILLLLLLNVNLSMAIVATMVGAALGFLLDPWLHQLGLWLLTGQEGLQAFWTSLYNNQLLALTRFNNTVVMGATVAALVAALPLFFLMRLLVRLYQQRLINWVKKLKIVQLIQGSKLFAIYQRLEG